MEGKKYHTYKFSLSLLFCSAWSIAIADNPVYGIVFVFLANLITLIEKHKTNESIMPYIGSFIFLAYAAVMVLEKQHNDYAFIGIIVALFIPLGVAFVEGDRIE